MQCRTEKNSFNMKMDTYTRFQYQVKVTQKFNRKQISTFKAEEKHARKESSSYKPNGVAQKALVIPRK